MTNPITREQMIEWLDSYVEMMSSHVPPDNNAFVYAKAIRAELSKPSCVPQVLPDDELDKNFDLIICGWEKNKHRCVYLNDFRIVGGKPWGGGSTTAKWSLSLRELIRAFSPLQDALGIDYLGNRIPAPPAPVMSGVSMNSGASKDRGLNYEVRLSEIQMAVQDWKYGYSRKNYEQDDKLDKILRQFFPFDAPIMPSRDDVLEEETRISEMSHPYFEGYNDALEAAAVFFENHAPTLSTKLEWVMKKTKSERWQKMVSDHLRSMKG